jgi:hypothetical protein
VFPLSAAQLPVPRMSSEHSVTSWAAQYHGIPATGNFVQATLQAKQGQTVIVSRMEVEVVRRRPPPHGTYAFLGGGCGGLEPDFYKADLDTQPARITESAGEVLTANTVRHVRPVPFPHQISNSSPEVWQIQANTTSCDCAWVGRVHWISEGREGVLELTEDGHPFRSAAISATTHVITNGREWEPLHPSP